MASPFDNRYCRLLGIGLLMLDAIGPRLWTGWLFGDDAFLLSRLSATNAITVYYLVLGSAAIMLVRWRRIDCRALFGAPPKPVDAFQATCIGIAILLLMVWADNWLTPRLRSLDAGYFGLDARVAKLHPIVGASGLVWWQNLLVASILTPLVEELLFRGILMQRIGHRFGVWAGLLGSSFGFAIWHDRFVGPFLFGVVLALIYARTGCLYLAVIAHGVANLFGFAGAAARSQQPNALTSLQRSANATEESQVFWALAAGISILFIFKALLWPVRLQIPYARNIDEPLRSADGG